MNTSSNVNKSFVLSVGGSVIVTSAGIDVKFLKKFRAFILSQVKRGYKFYLVIGGGVTCRDYIKAASKITMVNHTDRDWVGISATRLNAQLLRASFGSAVHSEIITDPTKRIFSRKSIVIAAGYKPGWSTDYDAILLARHNNVKTVINLSNIDYAYNKDPCHFKNAKKLKTVSWPTFRKIVGNRWKPGLNAPFDPIASREAAKLDMTVIILNGRNLKNLEKCLGGEKFKGTIIS
ncbi:MAG: UMP kinase [Candidatus Falkowbacteria bacterium]|nr:UMP kinase [Candidatus Falkowbacteria bacterium]